MEGFNEPFLDLPLNMLPVELSASLTAMIVRACECTTAVLSFNRFLISFYTLSNCS